MYSKVAELTSDKVRSPSRSHKFNTVVIPAQSITKSPTHLQLNG